MGRGMTGAEIKCMKDWRNYSGKELPFFREDTRFKRSGFNRGNPPS
jgi:hypothetical protein